MVELIQEARSAGARLVPACETAELPLRTYRRWVSQGKVREDQRPLVVKESPAHKLSDEEEQLIIEVCNSEKFKDRPPTQIVPSLLDEGIFIASESTFYRVLAKHKQNRHRGRAKVRTKPKVPETFVAEGPNELWSWDISYLPTKVKGMFYYLYMVMDIFSRKVVGFEVHDRECGELAAELMQRCTLAEKPSGGFVLHSDNGAPMKSLTLQAKLVDLDILQSFSRPRVSNDNPYSESLFRTVKYCPEWPPNGFSSVEEAREWVLRFVRFYNQEHKHSKIDYVTPEQRHNGEHIEILARRKAVLEAHKAKHPARWSSKTRQCEPVATVALNPVRTKKVA